MKIHTSSKKISFVRLFMIVLPIMSLTNTSIASGSASIPEGQCQHYHVNGTSGLNFYTCCNYSGEVCAAEEFDGASDENFCEGGQSTAQGGWDPLGDAFTCANSCDDVKRCKDFCNKEALSKKGFCWNWSLCFDACCESPPVLPTSNPTATPMATPAPKLNPTNPPAAPDSSTAEAGGGKYQVYCLHKLLTRQFCTEIPNLLVKIKYT